MEGGESVPREERENVRRTERDINAGKGRSMTVIVRWEAVVQTAHGKGRKERSKIFAIRKRHTVTSRRMEEAKVSEEKK